MAKHLVFRQALGAADRRDHRVGQGQEHDLEQHLVEVPGHGVVNEVTHRHLAVEQDRAKQDRVRGLADDRRTDEAGPQVLRAPLPANPHEHVGIQQLTREVPDQGRQHRAPHDAQNCGEGVLVLVVRGRGQVLDDEEGKGGQERGHKTHDDDPPRASETIHLGQDVADDVGEREEDAFVAVLGFVPRIVAASICGYLVGQLMNSLVLVKIRERWGAKHLWARLIGSTLVGEAFDTVIFCTIAFAGIIPGMEFVNYIVTGYVYKVGIEVVFLPITYRVIALVRRVEHLKSDEVLA